MESWLIWDLSPHGLSYLKVNQYGGYIEPVSKSLRDLDPYRILAYMGFEPARAQLPKVNQYGGYTTV